MPPEGSSFLDEESTALYSPVFISFTSFRYIYHNLYSYPHDSDRVKGHGLERDVLQAPVLD